MVALVTAYAKLTIKKYLTNTNNYDIAIITVKDEITFIPRKVLVDICSVLTLQFSCCFLSKVERIKYSKEWTGANVPCVLTGWGSLKDRGEKGPYPTYLQAVFLSTISYEECHNDFDFITTNNLCTLAEAGRGACSGDSGGN